MEDIYSTIAFALQREDITRAYGDKHQDDVVNQALTRQRTLLIIDNLETVDDEDILTFLRELPHPTKAIVTTRRRIDASFPIRLHGMPRKDATALMEEECNKKNIGKLNNIDQVKLNELTGGVPLAIVWSIAKLARSLPIESVLNRLTDAEGDISRFCFFESVDSIRNKPAYRLMLGLSVFEKDASREALSYITELPQLEQDLGLEELETLSLVNRHSKRFSMLPLTRTFASAELAKNGQLKEIFFRKLALFYTNFLLENRKGRSENIQTIILEKQNILGAMEWAFSNDHSVFLDIAGDMDYYFSISGDWVNRGKYLRLGIEIADELERYQEKARFLRLLAGQNQFQADYDLAIRHANESYAINSWLNDRMELTLLHDRYAAIYRELKDFPKAYEHVNKALELAKELNSPGLINRVYTLIVSIEINQGNYEKANEYMQLVWDYPQSLNWRTTWQSRQAGQIAFGLGKYDEAEELFLDAFEQASKIGNPRKNESYGYRGNSQNMAEAAYYLAKLYFQTGNIEKALEFAEIALTHFSDLGMNERTKRTKELIQNYTAK
ncbi:MAG: tetratricopeptide repeat protein [Chloroflexota bacterium]